MQKFNKKQLVACKKCILKTRQTFSKQKKTFFAKSKHITAANKLSKVKLFRDELR